VFANVVALRLASDVGRKKIDYVVAHLEGDAEFRTEFCGVMMQGGVVVGKDGSGETTGGQECGGLLFDDGEIEVDVGIVDSGILLLEEFAFAHFDDAVVDGGGEEMVVDSVDGFHNLCKIEVANEDGCFVVPEAVDGWRVAPEAGIVDDIVVDEGAGVEHFDGCSGVEDGMRRFGIEGQSATAGAD